MAEEIRGVIVNRSIPFRGPNDSETVKSFMEEVQQEVALLRESFNTWTRPILQGLPSRSNDYEYEITTDPDSPTDVDVVVHGLDGTQMFTDNDAEQGSTDPWTGNVYSDIYYVGGRPRTIKETIDAVGEVLDDLYASINSIASTVNTYIAGSTEQTAQLNQIQSMISSGNLQTMLNNMIQVARDIYDIGEAAFTGNGVQHLADTLQTRLSGIETTINDVDTLLNVDGVGDSNIKSNAGIGSTKISIAYPTENTGAINTLQSCIDRIATVISTLAHGSGNFSDWDQLPVGPTNITPQSLSTHINYVGDGGTVGASITNPHATGHADTLMFDTVALLTAKGLDGDLKQSFIRDDANELLDVVDHHITYERDIINRVSVVRHYQGIAGPLLYRINYTYDGNTDTVTQRVKIDYRRSLRIVGEAAVITTTVYTYDVNGYLTTETTTVT